MSEYPWVGSRYATLKNMVENGNLQFYGDCVDYHGVDTNDEPIVVLNTFERDIEDYIATVFKETKPDIYQIFWALGWLPEGKYDVVYSDTYTTCGNCGRAIDIGSDPRFVDGYMLGGGCEMWCEDCIAAHKRDYIDRFADDTDFPASYVGDINETYINSLGWTKVFHVEADPDLCNSEYRVAIRKIFEHNIYSRTLTVSTDDGWVDIYVRLAGPFGTYMDWLIAAEQEELESARKTRHPSTSARCYAKWDAYKECRNRLHEAIQEMF